MSSITFQISTVEGANAAIGVAAELSLSTAFGPGFVTLTGPAATIAALKAARAAF